jgi:hypothetical protein
VRDQPHARLPAASVLCFATDIVLQAPGSRLQLARPPVLFEFVFARNHQTYREEMMNAAAIRRPTVPTLPRSCTTDRLDRIKTGYRSDKFGLNFNVSFSPAKTSVETLKYPAEKIPFCSVRGAGSLAHS